MKNPINQETKEKAHLWKCEYCGATHHSTKNIINDTIQVKTYKIIDFGETCLTIKANQIFKD